MSEQFKEFAAEAAASAGRAAKLLAFTTGHKLQIIRQQERIRQLYTRLGKLCYKDRITDEEPDEAEYKPLCDEISKAYRCISRLRDEIEDAKEAYHDACSGVSEAEEADEAEDAEEMSDIDVIPFEE